MSYEQAVAGLVIGGFFVGLGVVLCLKGFPGAGLVVALPSLYAVWRSVKLLRLHGVFSLKFWRRFLKGE